MKNILQTNGFYVEYGAFDGLSNTFFAEKSLNWSGVLIEAEPNNFAQVLQKKRNAYLVPACLSLSTKTKLSGFRFGHHVYAHIDTTNKLHSVQVHCLPLYSILLALNRTTVDLFSLDIEGYELDVLKTIPFDKVDIAVNLVVLQCLFCDYIFFYRAGADCEVFTHQKRQEDTRGFYGKQRLHFLSNHDGRKKNKKLGQ